jgi:hypothetical protein
MSLDACGTMEAIPGREKQHDACAGSRSYGANLVITRQWTFSGESGDFFDISKSFEVLTP